uniref:Uncharacterized protein n=1 Tax=Arundo donax TaxID=35708 RepID=A0A0A9HW93_ARUDO
MDNYSLIFYSSICLPTSKKDKNEMLTIFEQYKCLDHQAKNIIMTKQ